MTSNKYFIVFSILLCVLCFDKSAIEAKLVMTSLNGTFLQSRVKEIMPPFENDRENGLWDNCASPSSANCVSWTEPGVTSVSLLVDIARHDLVGTNPLPSLLQVVNVTAGLHYLTFANPPRTCSCEHMDVFLSDTRITLDDPAWASRHILSGTCGGTLESHAYDSTEMTGDLTGTHLKLTLSLDVESGILCLSILELQFVVSRPILPDATAVSTQVTQPITTITSSSMNSTPRSTSSSPSISMVYSVAPTFEEMSTVSHSMSGVVTATTTTSTTSTAPTNAQRTSEKGRPDKFPLLLVAVIGGALLLLLLSLAMLVCVCATRRRRRAQRAQRDIVLSKSTAGDHRERAASRDYSRRSRGTSRQNSRARLRRAGVGIVGGGSARNLYVKPRNLLPTMVDAEANSTCSNLAQVPPTPYAQYGKLYVAQEAPYSDLLKTSAPSGTYSSIVSGSGPYDLFGEVRPT